MRMALQLSHECEVCLQTYSIETKKHDHAVAAIFGAEAYALCPACERFVEEPENPDYRLRADKFVEESGEHLPDFPLDIDLF